MLARISAHQGRKAKDDLAKEGLATGRVILGHDKALECMGYMNSSRLDRLSDTICTDVTGDRKKETKSIDLDNIGVV